MPNQSKPTSLNDAFIQQHDAAVELCAYIVKWRALDSAELTEALSKLAEAVRAVEYALERKRIRHERRVQKFLANQLHKQKG